MDEIDFGLMSVSFIYQKESFCGGHDEYLRPWYARISGVMSVSVSTGLF